MPAISLHSEKAAMSQIQDKGRVSVDVQGAVRPGSDGHDSGAKLGNVVRQSRPYEAV